MTKRPSQPTRRKAIRKTTSKTRLSLEHPSSLVRLHLPVVTKVKYVRLQKNYHYSLKLRNRLMQSLKDELGEPQPGHSPSVVVCGSLARLEASGQSDLDYMIVYPKRWPKKEAAQFRAAVERTLEKVTFHAEGMKYKYRRPNKKGVFAKDVIGPSLYGAIGQINEGYNTLSQRMLLVLESTPLWNTVYHSTLLDKVLKPYEKYAQGDASKHFVLLLNDLIRYFRLVCVNYHANTQDAEEFGKWALRNVKLRHSRVVMYVSLLLVLGELSKVRHSNPQKAHSDSQKIDTLRGFVELPPIERIIRVYESNEDPDLYRFLGMYNVFLEAVSREATREALEGLSYAERYKSPLFSSLKTNSDSFAAELTRFVFARQGSWSDRFYEYLVL